MVTYNSPLAVQQADPYVYKHTDGTYYFTATYPDYDRIAIRRASTINGLTTAEERTVWVRHIFGPMSSHIWAPEIHYVMGKWVIYFAAGSVPDVWAIRPYAIVCDSDDPMTGTWTEAGMMQSAKDDPYSFTDFSLDMTVFEHNQRWYTIWAEKVGRQHGISNLYIAELETPTKLKTVQVLLTTPDYAWERELFWVNEGPTTLKKNGKIFVTYSASGTGAMYCMGMLVADENSDLLDPTSWRKRNKPVCQTNEALKVFGPGHNSFVEGEEGETLCVLHFRSYEKIIGDPLEDHNRHAHIMRVEFDENGEPVFDLTKQDFYNVPFSNEKQAGIN